MRFFDALTLVAALVQREGRVSLRALRREFGFDDDFLDDLLHELTSVRGLATIVDDAIVVWSGGPSGQAIGDLPAQVAPRPPLESATRGHTETRPAEGARRQLTVMFCDLAGSTELSTRLDPEDLSELIGSYQNTCARVIDQYDGYIAKFMGDGILIYFGYPQAHENDADRALRTGLGIVEAMAEFNAALGEGGIALAVRIGIATGLVVVGETLGEGAAEEKAVVGETPNLAARLQGLAPLYDVVIGPATRVLVGEEFDLEDLGAHRLKGIAEPVPAWRVVGLRDAEARRRGRAVLPLVGRDDERGLLLHRWEQSKTGDGQVVLIGGEAGIGKSTLVDTVSATAREEGAVCITLRCSPYHTNSALHPVLEHLVHLLDWEPGDSADARLEKLERTVQGQSMPLADIVPLLAPLLSLPLPVDRYPPLNLAPQQQKQRTHDALTTWIIEEAARSPVLMVWQDVHWADPTTLELLGLMIDQLPTARMLNVVTFRPEFTPPWPMRSYVLAITLGRLERPESETLIWMLTGGKELPAEVSEHIVSKSGGVPLYVEELTKSVLESSALREEPDRYVLAGPLSQVAIPATLQESLMARLDRLPRVRELAQLGAVVGREFPYDMVQALAGVEEPALQNGLAQLVGSELLYQRGRPPRARYTFKHALIQDAAYQSLLRRTRQQYHLQIAGLLQAEFAELVETQPEIVAHHFTEAGRTDEAIEYWQRAGKRAAQQSAHPEAIAHFSRALELLSTLPDTPARTRRELTLQTSIGPALMVTKGYAAPDVVAAYARARELCRQLGDAVDLFPVLWGLWLFYLGRADYDQVRELGQQLLHLATASQDPDQLLEATMVVGVGHFYAGELQQAHAIFERSMEVYDPEKHHSLAYRFGGLDPGVAAYGHDGWTLWLLGYPDQAAAHAEKALDLALTCRTRTTARARSHGMLSCTSTGATARVRRRAEMAIEFATEHAVALPQAQGRIMRGWALVAEGWPAEGLAEIRDGLKAWEATGAAFVRTYFLALLAEAAMAAGKLGEGLAALADAMAAAEGTGERNHAAEVQRLEGELHLALSPEEDMRVEACFHRALDIARAQSAKSLELRAAMSLARLWQRQGRADDARELLSGIYGWFTEGFDTADLREARALLDALSTSDTAKPAA